MNPFSIAHDDLWQYMKKSCANTESTQVRQIREHKHAISNEHLVESEHTKALLDSRTGLLLCQQCSTGLRNIFSFLQQHCYRKWAGTAHQAAIIIPVRPLPPLLDGTKSHVFSNDSNMRRLQSPSITSTVQPPAIKHPTDYLRKLDRRGPQIYGSFAQPSLKGTRRARMRPSRHASAS